MHLFEGGWRWKASRTNFPSLAAEQVRRSAQQLFEEFGSDDDVATIIEKIVRESHTVIQLSGISAEKEPHSTVVILIITPAGRAVWGHVGDSRLYRFAGASLTKRTIDHSYVEKLISDKILNDLNESVETSLSEEEYNSDDEDSDSNSKNKSRFKFGILPQTNKNNY